MAPSQQAIARLSVGKDLLSSMCFVLINSRYRKEERFLADHCGKVRRSSGRLEAAAIGRLLCWPAALLHESSSGEIQARSVELKRIQQRYDCE